MSEAEVDVAAAMPARRNPMLASTEPTDEELHQVMREACDLAMQRKAATDDWVRQQLATAVREARERGETHRDIAG